MKFKVTQSATFHVGHLIKLDADQAAARSTCLEKRKAGKYEVTAPVQFKAGEIVCLDLDTPPKGMEACLEAMDVVKDVAPEVVETATEEAAAATDPVAE